jgi:hypothetical protein
MSFLPYFRTRQDLAQYGSAAIALAALQLRFEIDDIHTAAADVLTEGPDDKKCDLLYLDPTEGIAVIAQCYVATDEQRPEAPANKASDLNTAAGWLFSRDVKDLPERLRPEAEHLRAALLSDALQCIELWYVHNLPESQNVEQELATVQATTHAALEQLLRGSVRVPDVWAREIGRETLDTWYRSVTTPILVADAFDVTVPGAFEITGDDWRALVTAVPARWLYDLFLDHKSSLFSANVRGYLGSRRADANINNGIKQTARDEPGHLWPYNNGLTILVNDYRWTPPNQLHIDGLSIVNGAQTTGAIGSNAQPPDTRALVPARFVVCRSLDVITQIIRYNNSQNRIEAPDFRSNDPVQRRLRDEFSHIGEVTYLGGRRGGHEDRIRRPGNLLSADTAAQALAAFHGDPIVAYNEKSRIWVSDVLYSRYFSERTTARHVVLAYSLLKAVERRKRELFDRSTAGSLTEPERRQLVFLRHRGASFVFTTAIAESIETILNRPVRDRFQLSFAGQVDPEAALGHWMPVVRALLAFAGELIPAVDGGLKNTETVQTATKRFSSFVEATGTTNRPLYDAFTQRITTP